MPAIPYNNTPVVDQTWDGPGAEKKLKNSDGASVYRQEYAWVDPAKDADTKTAYALPHHEVSADGTPGAANVNGVRNALSRVPQSNIPDGDQDAVKAHLQKHLDKFNAEKSASDTTGDDPSLDDDDDIATPGNGAQAGEPRPTLDEMLRLPVPAIAAIAQEYLPLIPAASVQAPSTPAEARARAQVSGMKVASGGMVAVIPLQGVLTPRGSLLSRLFGFGSGGLEGFREQLRAAMGDPEVKAIVIDVDSPGGVVDMVPETAADVREARGNGKTIVAVANTIATSAAYWIASQADELVVTPSGQVGSIGVLAVHQDSSKLQDRIGITTTVISAGRFKAESFGPLSKAATQALQSNVDDLYDLFVADVAAGRNVSAQAVMAGYGEGRMVLAGNAKPLGMVDEIATLEATIVRLGGMPSDEDQDASVIPDDGDDDELDEDNDAPDQARAESGPSADRLYGEVGLNQPAWLLTD